MGRKQSRTAPGTHERKPGLWVPLCAAFLAGWVVMMLEILGGRLLAPYFGYSVYQWGALIGVVLSALTVGYFIGGRVGDGTHAHGFLVGALALAASCVLLVPVLAPVLLPLCRPAGPARGAVLASALLLGTPTVLLGTVSPVIVRLTFRNKIAGAAGGVYTVSTLGSIGGTFFTAFYAVPFMGTRLSCFTAGLLLILALAILALAAGKVRYLASAGLLLLAGIPPGNTAPAGTIYQGESIHNMIRVVDRPTTRSLYLNYAGGSQTVMPKGRLLTGQYYDSFLLGPILNQAKTVLFLGAAGGTSIRQVLTVYPDVKIVGVELDPEVLRVAEQYFGLKESPRLELVAEDARWYVETTREKFDLIAMDLYVTGHIPFFTTTVEFFEQVRERLTPRGMVMVHVRSVRQEGELLTPFVQTLRNVFPGVFVFGRGNYILVASREPVRREALVRDLKQGAERFPRVRPVADRALSSLRVVTAENPGPVFTDDRNDVELRTFRMSFQR